MATTKKTKEKDITVADVLVLLAFVVFNAMSYFGLSFGNGPSSCIIKLLGFSILLGALIYALKRVKRVENYFRRWIIVEAILFIAFISVAYKIGGHMVNALSATGEKEDLIRLGQSDIETIRGLFREYETKESGSLDLVKSSLKNLEGAEYNTDETVKKYKSTHVGSRRPSEYYELLDKKYLGKDGDGSLDYKAFYMEQDSLLSVYKSVLENWNLIKVSSMASNLNMVYDSIASRLTKISTQRHPEESRKNIPYKFVVKYDNYRWVIDEEKTKELEVDYTKYKKELQLADKISDLRTPSAVLLAALIYALMLVGYFVAPRSSTVDISAKSKKKGHYNDGGIDLY